MGFGCKVDDGVHFAGERVNNVPVADVAVNELVASSAFELGQIRARYPEYLSD